MIDQHHYSDFDFASASQPDPLAAIDCAVGPFERTDRYNFWYACGWWADAPTYTLVVEEPPYQLPPVPSVPESASGALLVVGLLWIALVVWIKPRRGQ
jgi:hypothetical protein